METKIENNGNFDYRPYIVGSTWKCSLFAHNVNGLAAILWQTKDIQYLERTLCVKLQFIHTFLQLLFLLGTFSAFLPFCRIFNVLFLCNAILWRSSIRRYTYAQHMIGKHSDTRCPMHKQKIAILFFFFFFDKKREKQSKRTKLVRSFSVQLAFSPFGPYSYIICRQLVDASISICIHGVCL